MLRLKAVPLIVVFAVAAVSLPPADAQTYSLHGGQNTPPQQSQKATRTGKKGKGKAAAPSTGPRGLGGFGTNIKIARLARAAETALKQGKYALAANYAQKCTEAASQDPKMWFLLGYADRMAGRLGGSVSAFQRGLQFKPNDVEGLSGLAQTYMKMGKPDLAKPLLMRVLASNPKRPNDLMIAGELFLQTKDYPQAIGFLQRAEALKPNTHSEVLLAVAFQRTKQPAKAKAYLARAEKRAPGNADVLRAVAGFYRDTGEYKQAIQALLKIKKPDAAVTAELGYTYQLAGDRDSSAKYYTKAAEMDAKDVGRQLAAAQSQLNTGNLEKANHYLQRAYAIDPNFYRVHSMRGQIALMSGNRDLAIREYVAALSTLPAEGVPEGPLFPVHLHVSLYTLYRDGSQSQLADQQLAAARTGIDALHMENNADYLRMRGEIRMYSNDLNGALADLKQASTLDPKNADTLALVGDVLWKQRDLKAAANYYQAALKLDPKNRSALSSLGYLTRAFHDRPAAEHYFTELAKYYPKDYTPHLALGDMYAEHREFDKAQGEYFIGWKLAPTNPLVVAGGAANAIEAKRFEQAKLWLDRAQGAMNDEPKVMRERERYLTWTKQYAESARIGYRAIKKMPNDRDVVVYLGYDLLYLGRYDDLLKLVEPYQASMPKEPDLPLLAGYAHKYGQLYDQAIDDFSRTIALNPKVTTAYVNRGYLYNSVGDPKSAIGDFNSALTLEPNNGEAHLGLGYANLELRNYKTALQQIDIAAQTLKNDAHLHLARATAYRGQNLFSKAETEYRLVAQAFPDDPEVQIGLGNVLFREGKYHDSIAAFEQALKVNPDNSEVLAEMAHDYASLHDREQTLKYVSLAEKAADYRSDVMLATGDALLLLGDENAALQHYEGAMNAPDSDRIQVRLSIARLMTQRGEFADAREQLGLAFAEARVGESSTVTADHLLQAANILTRMRDFDTAQKMFERARRAGAADEVVAMGLANLYVAEGQPNQAQTALASVGGNGLDYAENYQYELLQGEIYRERHENLRALSAFSRASQDAAPGDDTAQRAMLELAGSEGMIVTPNLSLQSNLVFDHVFEDPTVYMLDTQEEQRFGGVFLGQAIPPRAPRELLWNTGWHVHLPGVPTITGFVQAQNLSGQISIPSEDRIVSVDTTDLSAGIGLSPTLRMGRNILNFNGGVQFTRRTDSKNVAFFLNQNMVRPYLYVSTNPLFNWITVQGFAARETGSFTQRLIQPGVFLDSTDQIAKLDFKVGRPWGNTALLTGYWVRDLAFNPLARERYSTASYVGVQRRFGQNFRMQVVGEYIRSWRVHDNVFFEAQAMRPAFGFNYQPTSHWGVQGDFAWARGETDHTYDNAHTDFLVTYTHPVHRTMDDGLGETPVQYPLQFSFGLQQEQYFNFTGTGQSRFVPVFRLSVF